ncbi:MAG: GDP-fucose synthetase [Gammaproteobacteria bacterium RIFCSPLOWO2_02_FULL_38_11]|nr:MAG: GDP-fucose synthetase [Gammaproteobacteria bacterium RIFCSPLOWO2_02_FULL_38_11]OGT76545.1 MAG: GDP-fucose synthetase [Gammaproteobacteria bacterium RIFCSPLOWO2_12_FULL_38_14]
MKMLLTGASGMVGWHLKKILISKYDVLAPSREELNLLDNEATYSYIQKYKPNWIIHLASVVGGISANINNPVKFLIENVKINTNVIDAAFKLQVPYFLNFASSCMYPANRETLSENDLLTGELEPTNEGYALSKILSTKLCETISEKNGFFYKTIVPTNLYGPYDHFEESRSHLIPAIIKKMHDAKLENKKNVSIWGTGNARREFLYVEDLISFVFIAIEKIKILPAWINVGLGKDYSVREYYECVSDVVGYKPLFEYDLTKPEGMKMKKLNIQKALDLGWKPTTSLREGIEKTYHYYLSVFSKEEVL